MRPLQASLRESDRIRARRPEAEPIICQEETFQSATLFRDGMVARKRNPLQWTQATGELIIRI